MKIKITIADKIFNAELADTETGKAIYKNLPINSRVNVWGSELYFATNVSASIESDAKTVLNIGDLAFYPPMQAFCIFFGSTPVSSGENPEAAGPVNVFGHLINNNINDLQSLKDGSDVVVERL
ncbi:MAG: cyclophilin-like fold protein [Salinivirgaceae bacterium]|jgi:hypothetical protein|nr:cyclophilin-like fold protein [Salinivirgaceae bacterium]